MCRRIDPPIDAECLRPSNYKNKQENPQLAVTQPRRPSVSNTVPHSFRAPSLLYRVQMSHPANGNRVASGAEVSDANLVPGLNNMDIGDTRRVPGPSSNSSRKNSSTDGAVSRKPPKLCYQCGKTIIGTLVRAMDRIYHVDCFRCHDCGNPCSNKFFAADVQVDGHTVQMPLCEYDYFKRIDLICSTCDKAIRGSYITAVGRKFHPEHFFCDICHRVFDSEDYYEHQNKIYCHYHYSVLYAAQCEACKSAILKQYVELYRGGREQQWHPECFMVHKFWGVDVTAECVGMSEQGAKTLSNTEAKKSLTPRELFDLEKKLERMTMSIWLTLSEFEEGCASCISDMLHCASTGNQLGGLLVTGQLVLKIEYLFRGIDILNDLFEASRIRLDYSANHKLTPLSKEPRSMSSKIMSYLTFLRDTDKTKLLSNTHTQQLLSLISTLAHYIKLISRNTLLHALEYNKISRSSLATDRYLREISSHDSIPQDVFSVLGIPPNAKDLCFQCQKSIEEDCFRFGDLIWHVECFECSNCSRRSSTHTSPSEFNFNPKRQQILCASCSSDDVDAQAGFKRVSRYMQLIYLLKIALVRSRHAMLKRGIISKTPPQVLASSDSYDQHVTDIKRMRSKRQKQRIGTASAEARKSIVLEAPEASSAGMENVDPESGKSLSSSITASKFLKKERSLGRKGSKRLRIEDIPMKTKPHSTNLDVTSNLLKNEKGLTLDDIPRIVSSEQAREHRPNAFRFQKRTYTPASSTIPAPKAVKNKGPDSGQMSSATRSVSGAPSSPVPQFKTPSQLLAKSQRTQDSASSAPTSAVRYSEFSKKDNEYLQHIAAFALHRLMGDMLSLEDCLSFISVKKNASFWEKIFGGSGNSKKSTNKVFGCPLEDLVEKCGVESDLGIGPQKLKVPMLVDELINVMHTMDLSVEGVFRINGNIKRLKQLTEEIDSNPQQVPDFSKETPIQLAALLKKFTREMPDPLLTFKLYDLFILSQKFGDDANKKDRILKLAYCMLPKVHRDLAEVLLSFFNWVASFCLIDEENGSKMDVHNLATVITPNILYERPKTDLKDIPTSSVELVPQGENHFLAIEVINTLIETQDEFSIVPKDILQLFELGGFSKCQGELKTKDILARCHAVCNEHPNVLD
ncbi:hypothetical protein KL921_001983 [Ogataea angusta]|nr:hypothetical protein KL921_001983 [Ogataea angusta]